jgi:hypothetical protein
LRQLEIGQNPKQKARNSNELRALNWRDGRDSNGVCPDNGKASLSVL